MTDTATTDAPDLARYVVDQLLAAGEYKEAARVAIGAGKQAPPSSTAAPVTLDAAWAAADAEGGVLGLKHLRSLTLAEMGDLRDEHPALLERSIRSLKPGGDA